VPIDPRLGSRPDLRDPELGDGLAQLQARNLDRLTEDIHLVLRRALRSVRERVRASRTEARGTHLIGAHEAGHHAIIDTVDLMAVARFLDHRALGIQYEALPLDPAPGLNFQGR